jgi:HEPN domain-containing protein
MPRPDHPAPGSPADWLRHAAADLALAQVPLPEHGLYNTLCFHAQQAAEKSLKAVLISHGIEPPKVHSLTRLLDLLPTEFQSNQQLQAASDLTIYATTFRYPADDDDDEVSHAEYEEAVRIALFVFSWAKDVVGAHD